MVELLEVSAREMQRSIELNDVKHARWERDHKHLLIVEELCKRLRADNYFHNAGYDPETWKIRSDFERRKIVEHSSKMAQQDAIYLGKMFKFVQHWWN